MSIIYKKDNPKQQPAFLADFYDFVPAYSNHPDIEFYKTLSSTKKGKTLELGCGTGRILIPTALSGSEIVGLDISVHMLERCKKKLSKLPIAVKNRVELIIGSMTNFHINNRFELITAPFRVLQHLVLDSDVISCFKCIYKHLGPEGEFVFDISQKKLKTEKITFPTTEKIDFVDVDIGDGSKLNRSQRIVNCNPEHGYYEIELIFQLKKKNNNIKRYAHTFSFRYYSVEQLKNFLNICDFEIIKMCGDYKGSAMSEKPDEIIVTSKKRS